MLSGDICRFKSMEYVFWHVIEYGRFRNAVPQNAAGLIKERIQKGSVHWRMYVICGETYKMEVIESGFNCITREQACFRLQ